MFNKSMRINEILQVEPGTRAIFAQYGMGCLGCMGAEFETLENGARMHGVDLDALLAALNNLSAVHEGSKS